MDFKKTSTEFASQDVVILVSPSISDPYYKPHFSKLLKFYHEYASKLMERQRLILICDKDTASCYTKLPKEVLFISEVYDLWVRDFGLVNAKNPVLLKYRPKYLKKQESKDIQNSFKQALKSLKIKYKESKCVGDGGNVVDNGKDCVILTVKWLEDNGLKKEKPGDVEKGRQLVHNQLGYSRVAIIPTDDDLLGHSDGHAAFLNQNVIAVTDLSKIDEKLHCQIMEELERQFPEKEVVQVRGQFEEKKYQGKYKSARGVYVNSLVTQKCIYMPVFGSPLDQEAKELFASKSDKEVVTVNASGIYELGGSCRCSTMQLRE